MRLPLHTTPNVTPMIDVMLVLLIIFTVVTPALLDGAHLEPPRASHLRSHPELEQEMTLGIDAAGRYYLNKQPIGADALVQRLRARYAADSSDHVLYLKADRKLHYGNLLAVVDLARTSGVRVIAMVAERQ